MHRSSTLLRRSTLQLFEETVAITLVQNTHAVIGRTPSRRMSRRSSARCSGCSGCSGCTGRRRRREADAAGTRGLSSSRGAAFALASECSSPPRCSTRPRRYSPLPRASAPLPSGSVASVSGVPTLHGLADVAVDTAIGLACEGLLPEGPGVPTPLEHHGYACSVCRWCVVLLRMAWHVRRAACGGASAARRLAIIVQSSVHAYPRITGF